MAYAGEVGYFLGRKTVEVEESHHRALARREGGHGGVELLVVEGGVGSTVGCRLRGRVERG